MTEQPLLDALLDSWDRNNTILVNLLRLLPESALRLSPAEGSQQIGQLFMHMHYCRLLFIQKNAPEFARPLPEGEWRKERDPGRIEALLNQSAQALRDAVEGRLASGKAMDEYYDHPILFIQHMIWHEGYHHGQIKLALKQAGQPFDDEVAGPVTWDVWMDKTTVSP